MAIYKKGPNPSNVFADGNVQSAPFPKVTPRRRAGSGRADGPGRAKSRHAVGPGRAGRAGWAALGHATPSGRVGPGGRAGPG